MNLGPPEWQTVIYLNNGTCGAVKWHEKQQWKKIDRTTGAVSSSSSLLMISISCTLLQDLIDSWLSIFAVSSIKSKHITQC